MGSMSGVQVLPGSPDGPTPWWIFRKIEQAGLDVLLARVIRCGSGSGPTHKSKSQLSRRKISRRLAQRWICVAQLMVCRCAMHSGGCWTELVREMSSTRITREFQGARP